jgi:hypothetical protein
LADATGWQAQKEALTEITLSVMNSTSIRSLFAVIYSSRPKTAYWPSNGILRRKFSRARAAV